MKNYAFCQYFLTAYCKPTV